jgi:hypothetical protein
MDIYKASDNVNQADCLIVHSLGASTGIDSVNHELGVFALHIAGDRPIIADKAIADSLPEYGAKIALVVIGEAATHIKVEGKIPTPTIGDDGTWGILNVAKLDMDSIVPKDLPRNFDKHSNQFWTRSLYSWLSINLLGSLLLKRRGQL